MARLATTSELAAWLSKSNTPIGLLPAEGVGGGCKALKRRESPSVECFVCAGVVGGSRVAIGIENIELR